MTQLLKTNAIIILQNKIVNSQTHGTIVLLQIINNILARE